VRLRSALITLYIMYVAFILLSQVPILAKESAENRASTVHDYYLTFTQDGYTQDGHYYIERTDTTKDGRVNVIYNMDTNSLTIDAINVKRLAIFCHSIFKEKSMEVFGQAYLEDTSYYKTYFLDHDEPLRANIATSDPLEVIFVDIPFPYEVEIEDRSSDGRANNEDYYVSKSDNRVKVSLPPGPTEVTIHFRYDDSRGCIESIFLNVPTYGLKGETLEFNASTTFKCSQLRYFWDFGDPSGVQDWDHGWDEGNTITNLLEELLLKTHTYREVGNYTVIFTIFDDITPIYSEQWSVRILDMETDTDEDGLPDWWEEKYGMDPFNDEDADLDDDFDGITNFEEFDNRTDPLSTDTDRDGVSDFEEIELGIDPLSSDSDGDGFEDGEEVEAGTDPGDETDSPDVDKTVLGGGAEDDGSGLRILLILLIVIISVVIIFIVVRMVKMPSMEYRPVEREVSELVEYECPECGDTVTEGDTECENCGEKFEVEQFGCPSCGSLVPENSSECLECGEEFEIEDDVQDVEVVEYEDVEDEGLGDEDIEELGVPHEIDDEEGEVELPGDKEWDGKGGIESVCCPTCGSEINLSDGSCPGCGAVLDLEVSVESEEEVEESIEIVPEEEKPIEGMKKVTKKDQVRKDEVVDERPLVDKVDSVLDRFEIKRPKGVGDEKKESEEEKVEEKIDDGVLAEKEEKKVKKRGRPKKKDDVKKDDDVLTEKKEPKLEDKKEDKKSGVKKRRLKKRTVKKK